MNRALRYVGKMLMAADKEQVDNILSTWANVGRIYYKLSFPVYNESFSESIKNHAPHSHVPGDCVRRAGNCRPLQLPSD